MRCDIPNAYILGKTMYKMHVQNDTCILYIVLPRMWAFGIQQLIFKHFK